MYRYLTSLSLLLCSCGGTKQEPAKNTVEVSTPAVKKDSTPQAVPQNAVKKDSTPQAVLPNAVKKDSTPQNAASKAACNSPKGDLLESFSQNNTQFQRFRLKENTDKPFWFKVTLSDGSCKIVPDKGWEEGNHANSQFKDFDGDGLKDWIQDSKWSYKVVLFSKADNFFTQPIDGDFSGEQKDFDKTKSLKWQYMEDKMGGTYELYRLVNRKKVVYSSVSVSDDEISVHNNGVEDKSADTKALKDDGKVVQNYWRKNLAKIVR
jgi:hypothetical protein